MTGAKLIEELEKLTDDQLDMEVVNIHTEYNSSEDSIGTEIEQDIDSVSIKRVKNKICLGW